MTGGIARLLQSVSLGVILGNLAMIACLRRGGPRRTELLLSLKAPIVAGAACFWLGEAPSGTELFGAGLALSGMCLAIFLPVMINLTATN